VTPVQVPAAMADLLYVRRGEGRDVVVTTLGRRRSPGREHAQMADKLGEQNEDKLSSPSSFLQLQNMSSPLTRRWLYAPR